MLFLFAPKFAFLPIALRGRAARRFFFSRANAFPGGGHMNMIGEFVKRMIGELAQFVDWSLRNWTVTMIVLIVMIYWAGKQRRLNRHHL